MGLNTRFHIGSFLHFRQRKARRNGNLRLPALPHFRIGAALLVLAYLPCCSARAQGYMFGRASFTVGSTGTGPASIAVADFNGDGMVDAAVVQSSRNAVAILLGKTDGTLAPAVFYATGPQPVAVAVGDFNGDGRLDLAIANQNCSSLSTCEATGSISILLGNGDGTFQPQIQFASGTMPQALAVGDVNGDGKADLAVANGPLNSVLVYLGNGDGTFEAPTSYNTPGSAASVALADFNGDGHLDLAVGDSGVSIFLGNGDGTFQPAGNLLTLSAVNAVAVSDFNGDGAPDLAVTYADMSAVSVLLGNGGGTFQPRADYLTESNPTALAVGDFNGDGRPDLAVMDVDQSFSILLGNGDGTMQTARNFALPGVPAAAAVQDFNRDGKNDLAVVLSNLGVVSIVIGNGDGTFPGPQFYGSSLGAWAIAAGDFNDDGNLDLVTTDLDNNSISFFSGAGNGTFAMGSSATTGPVPAAAVAADFNRDGHLDLAVVNQTCTSLPCAYGSVSIFLGNGDGTFQPGVAYTTGSIPTAATVADFNGDGIPDLAIVNNGFGSSNTISLLIGKGDGTFVSGGTLTAGTGSSQAVAAEFAGNGFIDLAVTSSLGVSIIPGRGAGTFGPRTDYPITNGAYAIAVGDFNGDGKPDLALTTANAVAIMLGNGDGTFQSGVQYPVNSETSLNAILVGDFNGDGLPDLLVGQSSNAAAILLGNGDGTFQPAIEVALGPSERGLAAGNFDGTGGLDVAAASVGTNAISIALNAPVVALFPAALRFNGQGTGGTSTPETVTVSNRSGAPLAISSVTATGPFSVTNGCPASLPPGGSCALNISFSPTSAGSATGVLIISDNAAGGTQFVPLQGVGIGEPAAEITPPSVLFASQNAGTVSAATSVTVVNSGAATLNILSVSISGDFAANNACPAALPAGAQCTIGVTFSPSAPGTLTGALTITDNAASGSQSISLTGVGVAKPIASLSASMLNFGDQRVNASSSPQTLTLMNSGNASLQISSIDATTDFSVGNSCPASLAAGANCTISISFAPTAMGNLVGTVSITDNAGESPQAVALTGTGVAPQISLAPSQISFASQVVGTASGGKSLTLANSGNAPLSIESIGVSGTNAADFTLQNQCGATIAPGAACSLVVTFDPSAAGNRAATLNVATNAGSTPQSTELSGAGIDFTLAAAAGSATQLTVAPGQLAEFHLQVLPEGMQTSVSFTCTGAPAESSCQVLPGEAALDGSTPVALGVSIQTTAPGSTSLLAPHMPSFWACGKTLILVVSWLFSLAVLKLFRRRMVFGPLLPVLFAMVLAGCGGGQSATRLTSSQPGTPVGTYVLTVTATSAQRTHATTLTLTVRN